MHWQKNFKIKVKKKEPLKTHTSFKIGGQAEFFILPRDIEELRILLDTAKRYKMPFRIIGSGSNILVSDKGLKGFTISLDAPYFKKINIKKDLIEAGAACYLNNLIQYALRNGLGGIEFLSGIPGTLGGALTMNAGITLKVKRQKAQVKSIGDLIETVTVMDYNGNVKQLKNREIDFGYRVCSLSKYIILNAKLRLKKADKNRIKKRIAGYLKKRRNSQDYSHPSAGCIFKNPPGNSAGRLIDLCGLKGERIGDACVSWKHANFIVNLRKARATDVLRLMDLIKKEVKKKFGVSLEPEIKIW
jgi:UDP-N-acetylmuramate dehydrogenase